MLSRRPPLFPTEVQSTAPGTPLQRICNLKRGPPSTRRVLGNLGLLPPAVQRAAARVMHRTWHHDGGVVNICMSYTGREDMLQAALACRRAPAGVSLARVLGLRAMRSRNHTRSLEPSEAFAGEAFRLFQILTPLDRLAIFDQKREHPQQEQHLSSVHLCLGPAL